MNISTFCEPPSCILVMVYSNTFYTYQPNYITHFPEEGNVHSTHRSNFKSIVPIFTIMRSLYVFRAKYANYSLNICVQM